MTADRTDHLSTAAPRRNWPALATAAAVTAIALAAALATSPATPAPDRAPTHPRSFPHRLSTHCGIDETRIGKTYYEAETPLVQDPPGPPPGWDHPAQAGTMTLLPDTTAVFRDDRGHEVRFRPRPGARDFARPCR